MPDIRIEIGDPFGRARSILQHPSNDGPLDPTEPMTWDEMVELYPVLSDLTGPIPAAVRERDLFQIAPGGYLTRTRKEP
jgi:hypothetical protein